MVEKRKGGKNNFEDERLLQPLIEDDDEDGGGDEGGEEGGAGSFTTDDDNYFNLLSAIRDGEIKWGEVPETVRQRFKGEGKGLAAHPLLESKVMFDGASGKLNAKASDNDFAKGDSPNPKERPSKRFTNSNTPRMAR